MPDPRKKPLTELLLSMADRAGATPLFNDRAEREWPSMERRVLKALHLSEDQKFELCWEEFNLLDRQTRDRCFQILKVPGVVPVALDNGVGRTLSKVSKWIPTSWVMRPLDKYIIMPTVKAAVTPLTALLADLPKSPDRNKDARAWRDVLALAPSRLVSLGVRVLIMDAALDMWVDTGSVDAAAAPPYDITAADNSGQAVYGTDYTATVSSGQHPFAQFQAAMHAADTAASVSTMQQVTLAFQPLITTLEKARGHGLVNDLGYMDDIIKAAHQSVENLPPGVQEAIRDAGGLANFPWGSRERQFLTITAF